MGPVRAKLVEFDIFRSSFRQHADEIRCLESVHIYTIGAGGATRVAARLWNVISQLQIGIGETKIVAGSKALHHVLPNLVPPIDREYTLMFFYNHKTLNRGDEAAFSEMYPYFQRVAATCRHVIEAKVGSGMNTSATKVMDNAIVGFCRRHPKV